MEWHYGPPPPGGDSRKMVTLLDGGMVWVGIRAWNPLRQQWFNSGEPEHVPILAWMELPLPAMEQAQGNDQGVFWPEEGRS